MAYTFNDTTNACIFGDFTGIEDPIYLAPGEGLRIEVDTANPVPVKSPHIAIFGGTNKVSIDISLYDDTSTTSPWFPDWPGPSDQWWPVGTYIDNGFLVCGGNGALTCHHLKLGSDTWKVVQDIPHTGSTLHKPGYISLGSNTFWVHAGWSSGHKRFSWHYFGGKWTLSRNFESPVAVDRHCLARIDHRRVSIVQVDKSIMLSNIFL